MQVGRPLKKSNDFNRILKVSRQQSLPDEDVAITEPQRKQWTDWPEPSRQGESRQSAYVDLDKWEKHQSREHAGGVRVSDGRAPTVQSVDHSSRRGEHLLHQEVQEVRKQTGKVQSLEVDLSERPTQRTPSASGVSASSSEEREAREAKGRERVEAILAKDRNALVLGKGRYVLPGRVASQLYPHQRESIEWLWSLHMKKTGGILGDDMGLGMIQNRFRLSVSRFLCTQERGENACVPMFWRTSGAVDTLLHCTVSGLKRPW
jgi:SNF2 family DNA or RNA helicase